MSNHKFSKDRVLDPLTKWHSDREKEAVQRLKLPVTPSTRGHFVTAGGTCVDPDVYVYAPDKIAAHYILGNEILRAFYRAQGAKGQSWLRPSEELQAAYIASEAHNYARKHARRCVHTAIFPILYAYDEHDGLFLHTDDLYEFWGEGLSKLLIPTALGAGVEWALQVVRNDRAERRTQQIENLKRTTHEAVEYLKELYALNALFF